MLGAGREKIVDTGILSCDFLSTVTFFPLVTHFMQLRPSLNPKVQRAALEVAIVIAAANGLSQEERFKLSEFARMATVLDDKAIEAAFQVAEFAHVEQIDLTPLLELDAEIRKHVFYEAYRCAKIDGVGEAEIGATKQFAVLLQLSVDDDFLGVKQ